MWLKSKQIFYKHFCSQYMIAFFFIMKHIPLHFKTKTVDVSRQNLKKIYTGLHKLKSVSVRPRTIPQTSIPSQLFKLGQFCKISQNLGSSCTEMMTQGWKPAQLTRNSIFFTHFPKNLLSQFSQVLGQFRHIQPWKGTLSVTKTGFSRFIQLCDN